MDILFILAAHFYLFFSDKNLFKIYEFIFEMCKMMVSCFLAC